MLKKLSLFIFVTVQVSFAQAQAQTQNPTLDQVVSWQSDQYWDYQMVKYAETDPAGDLILARMVTTLPFDLIKILLGSKKISVPEQDMNPLEASPFCRAQSILDHTCKEAGYISRSEMPNPPAFVEGTLNPLNQPGLRHAFIRVIQEEHQRGGLTPFVTPAPSWSEEFIRKFTNKLQPFGHSLPVDFGYVVDSFEKPLYALLIGATSRFMATDKDMELTNWITSQPINSLSLIDVFRKSYQLQNGNLHHALLSIENVFSRRWRHAHREDLQMTRRLRPFTNWKDGVVNDNFGAWYHFWGVAYYGLIAGKAKALWAANVEHQGSVLLGSDEFEKQEHFVNIGGAILGAELAMSLKDGSWKTLPTKPSDTEESAYRIYEY